MTPRCCILMAALVWTVVLSPVPARAGNVTDRWLQVTATVAAPGAAPAGVGFAIWVDGQIARGEASMGSPTPSGTMPPGPSTATTS